ncbi:phosphotransferase family protein [Allokutzneria oryzae]|uniref:Phosphotransferase family protein n=1 Tax=Allokutzneria oryzae TaxID=1378989 RepID=A0ABV5ZVV4_9PSEU
MEAVERESDAFQRPVSVEQIEAMCRRAFGDRTRVARIVEIGVGHYNTTYRIDIEGRDPVILRVAPERAQQAHWDRDVMRNEYAAAPYFAALGTLVPQNLAVDFTHQIIGRDYMFQTLLPGAPASTTLDAYPRSQWPSYYRQLGTITRAVHEVRGDRFGRVAGPGFDTWSEALSDQFRVLAADFDDAGLDSGDVHRVIDAVGTHRAALDEVTEPRLLHGDLWTLNIMLDPDAAEPTITGVLDFDVACWGDPMADWTIHRARQQPGTEVAAFWETYGRPATDAASAVRELFYQARNLVGVQLDIHRRGIDISEVPPIHWDVSDVLARLSG